jgi:hypothetical protein
MPEQHPRQRFEFIMVVKMSVVVFGLWRIFGIYVNHEDWGDLLQNVGNHLQYYISSQLRRPRIWQQPLLWTNNEYHSVLNYSSVENNIYFLFIVDNSTVLKEMHEMGQPYQTSCIDCIRLVLNTTQNAQHTWNKDFWQMYMLTHKKWSNRILLYRIFFPRHVNCILEQLYSWVLNAQLLPTWQTLFVALMLVFWVVMTWTWRC